MPSAKPAQSPVDGPALSNVEGPRPEPGGRLRLGVLASGRGSNFQAILNAIDEEKVDADVVVAISDKTDAYALERARKRGIAAVHIDPKQYPNRESFDEVLAAKLKEHRVDLVILAGYMRLVSRVMTQAFPYRILNVHPGLLPSFPGLNPQKKALDHGVRFSGCTVHFVDDTVDDGPIIIQAVVPVFDEDTEEMLSLRILMQEHRIYPEAIQLIAEGRLKLEGRRVVVQGEKYHDEDRRAALVNPPMWT
ncbi:MAG: phosphoribosylglycinamide formyltransferase [Nitrospirae bacterium]|nr:phosphoribosylglycinamide formyltransferase [Nitrospirota bacterium]